MGTSSGRRTRWPGLPALRLVHRSFSEDGSLGEGGSVSKEPALSVAEWVEGSFRAKKAFSPELAEALSEAEGEVTKQSLSPQAVSGDLNH